LSTEIRIPDIGDFKDVEVIEVLVKPGDHVDKETPLLTLETEKATIDVPSPRAGTVRTVALKKGDRVSKDRVILELEEPGGQTGPAQEAKAGAVEKKGPHPSPLPEPGEGVGATLSLLCLTYSPQPTAHSLRSAPARSSPARPLRLYNPRLSAVPGVP
jgi:pyruvate dehydrogenase E2 component (dihydrolipoamide acetyltransferase)